MEQPPVDKSQSEKPTTLVGGIDFSHLPHRELTKLSGHRIPSFQIVFRQSALNQLHAHGDSSPRAEICGVLVGDVYQDTTGAFLLVEHIIEGESSTGSAGQVTFTADTWQHIQLKMDRQYPDLRICGWYHTHPGHGVFLSEMDIFLHESFFGLPWQAALVYDPKSGEEGIFNASQGQAHRLDYLIEADEPASSSSARVYHSPVYNAPPIVPVDAPKPVPVIGVRRKDRRWFWHPFRQTLLAIIGLTLFTAMGILLGLIIRLQHFDIELPYWIQHMVHG
jgi:proteasome lid subunit RPN8/RPN11